MRSSKLIEPEKDIRIQFNRILAPAMVLLLIAIACARLNRPPRQETSRPSQGQVSPAVIETSTEPGLPETVSPSTPSPGAVLPGSGLPQSVPNDGPMILVEVSDAQARNAVCNDGSPAAYYFRRGVGEGNHRWLIHLQGGGFCSSRESCQKRAGQMAELMSSDQARNVRPGNGIQSPSANVNPGFADANVIFVRYCSSDLWSGDRTATTETGGLHFNGASIVRAVIEDLSNPSITPQPNLADADRVLFSGSSAGGVGVLVHLDWLAEKLPQAVLKGVDDAGWFIDIEPYDPSMQPIREQAKEAYQFWNGTVDESCAAANAGMEGLCYLGPYVYPQISTPLFVQIAQFDGPQLVGHGIRPPIDDTEREYALKFAAAIQESLQPVEAAFSPADRTHGLLTNAKYQRVRIDNSSLRDVIVNWFFDQPPPWKFIEEVNEEKLNRLIP